MTKAEAACAQAVKTQIAPALEAAAEAVIGKRDGGWFEFLTDPNTNSQVLLFHYPSSQSAGFGVRSSEFGGSLVFKGGTSLSKVFGVIERFSEDLDLSLSPEFLKLPEAGTSRNQANST